MQASSGCLDAPRAEDEFGRPNADGPILRGRGPSTLFGRSAAENEQTNHGRRSDDVDELPSGTQSYPDPSPGVGRVSTALRANRGPFSKGGDPAPLPPVAPEGEIGSRVPPEGPTGDLESPVGRTKGGMSPLSSRGEGDSICEAPRFEEVPHRGEPPLGKSGASQMGAPLAKTKKKTQCPPDAF